MTQAPSSQQQQPFASPQAHFHQETRSINPPILASSELNSHYIQLNHVSAHAMRRNEPEANSQEATSDNAHHQQKYLKGHTSASLLEKPLKSLASKPVSLPSLHASLTRMQHILNETGIFREVRVELEDDDLLGERISEPMQQTDVYGRQKAAGSLLSAKARRANIDSSPKQHIYYANARIHAIEKSTRRNLGLSASVNMDGDTEMSLTASYRNLLHLADVTSLSVSGTNAAFNDILSKTEAMSWAQTLTHSNVMWSLSWKAPFILGDMFTARIRTGTEPIHDTDILQHTRGLELQTQLNAKHSLEYSIAHRDLLVGGNVESTMNRMGGDKTSTRSEWRHTYVSQELSRDDHGSPFKGYSLRLENALAGLFGLGTSSYAKSQAEVNMYIPLVGPLVASFNTKVGAVAPLSVFQRAIGRKSASASSEESAEGAQKDALFLGDRVFTSVRGYPQVGPLTYVEQIQNGKNTIDSYESKGGNLAASATARVILPFRSVPKLNGLSFLYAHSFVSAGNTVPYDFRSGFDWRGFSRGVCASYGGGLFIPMGSMRIELNYAMPLHRPLNQVGALQNFQRWQLRFFMEW